MVPKEKAALAYRETVRRRVDPALVEWSGAGVFQCRVFPLAPQSLHRVTIGYDVDLLRVGDDLELRLDLPDQTPACVVDFNIAARRAKASQPRRPGHALGRRPAAFLSAGRSQASGRWPCGCGSRARRCSPGRRGKTGELLCHPRGRCRCPKTPDRADRPPGSRPFSWSIRRSVPGRSSRCGPSCSGPCWRTTATASSEFAVLFFNVETFWWQEKFVANTPENVEALMNYADGLALEGATDLGRALKEAAVAGVVEEGRRLARARSVPAQRRRGHLGRRPLGRCWRCRDLERRPGPSRPEGGGRGPLFAYHTGLAGGDPRLLAHLAEQTGGAVFSRGGRGGDRPASVAHRNRPWRLTGIEMAGGHDLLVAGRPQYRLSRPAVAAWSDGCEAGTLAGRPRSTLFHAPAGRGDADHQRDQDGPRARLRNWPPGPMARWPSGSWKTLAARPRRSSRSPRPTPGTSA